MVPRHRRIASAAVFAWCLWPGARAAAAPVLTSACGDAPSMRIVGTSVDDLRYERGNGDGDFDYGELVKLGLTVQNVGGSTARGVVVELLLDSPVFSSSSEPVELDDLARGKSNVAYFKLEAQPSNPEVPEIPITVRIWGDGEGLLFEGPLPLVMNTKPPVSDYDTVPEHAALADCPAPPPEPVVAPEPVPVPAPPAPRAGRAGRRPALIAFGVGGAGLGLALGAELLARSTYDDYQRDLQRPQAVLDRANHQRDVANVAALVGVAGLATGAAMLILSLGSSSTAPTPIAITPALGPATVGLTAAGRY